ncbi:MAG: site-2 protease family protein [Micromonosporaceae bacterium]|nr:site-2 protease family protein [Micromonosporaceae bacterium]
MRLAGQRAALYRPSWIFLALVAITVASGWLVWAEIGFTRVNVFLFVLAAWVVSLCLHEYAHAVFALRGGDRGVIARGYLTLNPLQYAHPVLSIVLPLAFLVLGGIGLPGGAVWVDHNALSSRRARSLVSLAGPGANLACALLLVAPFVVGVSLGEHTAFWAAIAFLAFLQLTATLLNLLPIPGVDGGNMIEPWLNYEWQRNFARIAPYGMLVLFLLLASPRINTAFFAGVDTVGSLLGLPAWLADQGYGLFRFWILR